MSQAQLAELADTSQQTVDRIERGETVHSRAIPKLFMALGIGHEDHNPPASGTLAARVQARIDHLGLNAYSAAMKSGLGASYVRDILRGKVADPTASKLLRLAAVLECSIYYLLGADDLPGSDPTPRQAEKNGYSIQTVGPGRVALTMNALVLPEVDALRLLSLRLGS